jgi:hypothetical protein
MIRNLRTNEAVQASQESTPKIKPNNVRVGLMNPDFDYKPAVNTDVRKTWMRFGWKPVHEHDIEGERDE